MLRRHVFWAVIIAMAAVWVATLTLSIKGVSEHRSLAESANQKGSRLVKMLRDEAADADVPEFAAGSLEELLKAGWKSPAEPQAYPPNLRGSPPPKSR